MTFIIQKIDSLQQILNLIFVYHLPYSSLAHISVCICDMQMPVITCSENVYLAASLKTKFLLNFLPYISGSDSFSIQKFYTENCSTT